jgi:thymidylate kinase
MLIEFFGLPGSGKTTLSHIVASILEDKGICASEYTYDIDRSYQKSARLFKKLLNSTIYFCGHPYQGTAALTSIAATKQATTSDLCKSLLNWMYISSLSSGKHDNGQLTILDQGIAQALWSIGLAARHEAWLDLLMDQLHWEELKPDLIVHVRADHRTIVTRLATRQVRTSRLDHIRQDLRPLQQAQAHSESILRKLRSDGVRVVDTENDCYGRLAANAKAIADTIVETLDHKDDIGRVSPMQSLMFDDLPRAYRPFPDQKS